MGINPCNMSIYVSCSVQVSCIFDEFRIPGGWREWLWKQFLKDSSFMLSKKSNYMYLICNTFWTCSNWFFFSIIYRSFFSARHCLWQIRSDPQGRKVGHLCCKTSWTRSSELWTFKVNQLVFSFHADISLNFHSLHATFNQLLSFLSIFDRFVPSSSFANKAATLHRNWIPPAICLSLLRHLANGGALGGCNFDKICTISFGRARANYLSSTTPFQAICVLHWCAHENPTINGCCCCFSRVDRKL